MKPFFISLRAVPLAMLLIAGALGVARPSQALAETVADRDIFPCELVYSEMQDAATDAQMANATADEDAYRVARWTYRFFFLGYIANCLPAPIPDFPDWDPIDLPG